MAADMYHPFWEHVLEDNVGNLTSVTVKALLVDPTYVFDPDHEFVSSVAGDEVSGTGYAAGFSGAGRVTLASKTVTRDDTNNYVIFDAADVSWAGLNLGATQIGAIILWLPKTSDADSLLICYDDTGGFPVTTTGGTYQHAWPSDGIFRFRHP